MTLLMATNRSNGLPLWMELHSDNASDQKKRLLKECKIFVKS